MRGPTTAWPGATPGRLRAAGLHNVDARTTPTPRPAPHNPVREDGLNEYDEIGVFLGLDVGKSHHHGHGLTPAGTFRTSETRRRPFSPLGAATERRCSSPLSS